MRLNRIEKQVIKDTCLKVFGKDAKVFLFGSRLDDTKRGGDIDLLIKSDLRFSGKERIQLKIKFLIALKKELGDQKIDVLIDAGQDVDDVYITAQNEGIEL